MKQSIFFFGAVILVALFLAIVFLVLPSLAAPGAPAESPQEEALPPGDYLIALPAALPDELDLPAGLSRVQAAEYARRLTHRQARPILALLQELRAAGLLAEFQVRPDLHGVLVSGAAPQALEALSGLPGAAAVMSSAENLPACAAAAAEALPKQILGLSRARQESHLAQAPQATDPSINVYLPPGGDYGSVNGRTSAGTPVSLRILRGGTAIASATTTSSSSGYYYFYPSWHDCPYEGYSWILRPGDVVEVTAHGNTVSTVVAPLSAWVDPTANTASGKTAAGRSVEVRLYASTGDPCVDANFTRTVPADAGGNFSADFNGLVDFNRRASTTIYARDANENSTYAYFEAYIFYAYFDESNFWGVLKPKVDFTATLRRSGNPISTYRGRSEADNYYQGWFTETIQAGDVVSVNGGGVTIQYTATSLQATVDPGANQVAGLTGPGRTVQVYFEKGYRWSDIPTSCSWDGECASAVAGGGGAFAIPSPLDLERGDFAYLDILDSEGNTQYGVRVAPAIAANLSYNTIYGYWRDPLGDTVNVIVKTAGGAVKSIDTNVWVSSWDGYFYTYPSATALPSDLIQVSDGTITETMTVQNLSARLDGGSGHLAGGAYNGPLLATLDDFRRDGGWWDYCVEATPAGGLYDLTFSGAQVGGQDESFVWNTGPDGHYTNRRAPAFSVNAQKGSDRVYGYSETPNTPVVVTLLRGDSPIASESLTASSSGYFNAYLDGPPPATITQGDTLRVQTGDGDSVDIPIPELTVGPDVANNRLVGRSPASQPVWPHLRRRYRSGWYGWTIITSADSAGNFSVSFNDRFWWRDCSPVLVGHRCAQHAVYYYTPADHQIWLEGALPPPAGADSFESDNSAAAARVYTGVQTHSFHASGDEDWVRFTVTGEDVSRGASFLIQTIRMGWGMGAWVRLYDASLGMHGEWYGYEYGDGRGVSVEWTPTAAGTYYLQIRPPSSSYAAYCDAWYDVYIQKVTAQLYLPLTMHDHYDP